MRVELCNIELQMLGLHGFGSQDNPRATPAELGLTHLSEIKFDSIRPDLTTELDGTGRKQINKMTLLTIGCLNWHWSRAKS